MIQRSRLTLALSFAVASCWPVHEGLQGTVTTMPSSDRPASSPLAGARVEVVCPGSAARITPVATDQSGRFFIGLENDVSMACDVAVSKPGYVARRYRVQDVCAIPGRSGCSVLTVVARLLPEMPR